MLCACSPSPSAMIVSFPEVSPEAEQMPACFLYSLQTHEPVKPLFFINYLVSGVYLQKFENGLIQTLILLARAEPLTSPKPPPHNTITLEMRFQPEFWWDANTETIVPYLQIQTHSEDLGLGLQRMNLEEHHSAWNICFGLGCPASRPQGKAVVLGTCLGRVLPGARVRDGEWESKTGAARKKKTNTKARHSGSHL